MEEDKIRNLQVLFNISLPNDWQSLSDIQHHFFQLVIVSPKIFVKEFCYFLMSCHQHCLGVNLLVQM